MVAEATDDDYRAFARYVLGLYASTSGQSAVQRGAEIKFQATFPLAMCALNQVHAALILGQNGLQYLAVANIRVAYEHAGLRT